MMDARDVLLAGERVELPIPGPLPIQRGSLDVWLAATRGGPAAHPTLARTVRVEAGRCAPFSVFARDVRALFPRGGRVWLVVTYAGELLATGPLTLVP